MPSNFFVCCFVCFLRSKEFSRSFFAAYVTLAVLFVAVGVSSSIAFPDADGSIIAYLVGRHDCLWFQIINALVSVAVLLAFPLQLLPVMQAIEGNDTTKTRRTPTLPATLTRNAQRTSQQGSEQQRLITRLLILSAFAVIALLVDNVALLVALFGAVGQTALVLMPCAVHIRLKRMGIAKKSLVGDAFDFAIILFCIAVMVSGTASAIEMIRQEMTKASAVASAHINQVEI
jgi:hypothetical protein